MTNEKRVLSILTNERRVLPGGQVPPPVLGVDLVQVLGEEPVLLGAADAHQVGLVAVVVSVAL